MQTAGTELFAPEIMADRLYLRDLRGAVFAADAKYHKWATALDIMPLKMPHLSTLAKEVRHGCPLLERTHGGGGGGGG